MTTIEEKTREESFFWNAFIEEMMRNTIEKDGISIKESVVLFIDEMSKIVAKMEDVILDFVEVSNVIIDVKELTSAKNTLMCALKEVGKVQLPNQWLPASLSLLRLKKDHLINEDERLLESSLPEILVEENQSEKIEYTKPVKKAKWTKVEFNGAVKYVCAVEGCDCDLSWSKTSGVWKHFRNCHACSEDLIFSCDQCDEKFPTKTLRSMHTSKVHPRQLSCKYCCKTFTSKSLKSHELRHTGEKPLSCTVCDYVCVNKSMLNSHLKKHQKSKQVCETCGQSFPGQVQLREHARLKHELTGKTFLCAHCGKKLLSNSGYRRHLVKIHDVKFACEICGKAFSSNKWMNIHRRDIHGIQI